MLYVEAVVNSLRQALRLTCRKFYRLAWWNSLHPLTQTHSKKHISRRSLDRQSCLRICSSEGLCSCSSDLDWSVRCQFNGAQKGERGKGKGDTLGRGAKSKRLRREPLLPQELEGCVSAFLQYCQGWRNLYFGFGLGVRPVCNRWIPPVGAKPQAQGSQSQVVTQSFFRPTFS